MNENKPLFCSNCGKKIQGHGKFCSFCGAEIPQIDGTDIEMQLSGNDSKTVMEPVHTALSGQNEKHSSFGTLDHGSDTEIKPEKNNSSTFSVITAIAVIVLALACVVCFMMLPQYRMIASIALILVGAVGFYIAYHIGKKDFMEQSAVYAAGVDLGVSNNEELFQIIQGMRSETVLKIWIDDENVKIQGKRGVHDFFVDNNLVKIRVPLALLNVYRSVLRSIKQMRIHGQSRKLAEANSIMDEMIRWSGRKGLQHEVSYDTAGRGGKILFPSFPSIIIGGVLLCLSILLGFNEECIGYIKDKEPLKDSNVTYGEVFDYCLDNPEWEFYHSDQDKFIVEVTGKSMVDDSGMVDVQFAFGDVSKQGEITSSTPYNLAYMSCDGETLPSDDAIAKIYDFAKAYVNKTNVDQTDNGASTNESLTDPLEGTENDVSEEGSQDAESGSDDVLAQRLSEICKSYIVGYYGNEDDVHALAYPITDDEERCRQCYQDGLTSPLIEGTGEVYWYNGVNDGEYVVFTCWHMLIGGDSELPMYEILYVATDHADKFYVDMAYSKFHQMYGFHEDTGYEKEKADQIKACWEQGDFWGLYDEYKEELEEYLESENGDVAAQYLERVNMDMDSWFSDFDSVGDSISKITDVYY